MDSVQEELNRLHNWCNEFKGRIHPHKACVLWCSLNNRAVKAIMPTVTIEGKELQREETLKFLGITSSVMALILCHYQRLNSKDWR